jgi:hypothetical protein
VVAGIGVGQIVLKPTLFIIGFGVFIALVSLASERSHVRRGPGGLFVYEHLLITVLSGMFLVAFLFILPPLIAFIIAGTFFVVFNLLVLLSALRAGPREEDAEISRESEATNEATNRPTNGKASKWAWISLLAAIAVPYLGVAVDVATDRPPPLPTIVITATSNMDGKLLTHTDGFWYVFEDEGKDKSQLVGIPDEEVTSVRIYEK